MLRLQAAIVPLHEKDHFWANNGGAPYCPRCGCLKVHALSSRPVWKCSGCAYQFSVTAGTIFADRKRPIRDYLLAILITDGFLWQLDPSAILDR
jgi:hypothetical protein